MKKEILLVLSVVLMLSLTACGHVSSTTTDEVQKVYDGDKKILIAYFTLVENVDTEISNLSDQISSQSVTRVDGTEMGNAAALAQFAQKAVGGDISSIQVKNHYPGDYDQISDKTKQESLDKVLPELSVQIDDFEQYDTVILISSIWWGNLPRPVVSFLNKYDFSGKRIIPITTSVSSGLGTAVSEIKSACPDALVTEGLGTTGGTAKGYETAVSDFLAEQMEKGE
ncbi:MAG: flavodoxin [Clostridia bacterium]|nr:flavodoxin [Clostridia bacterium]